jgi:hypothetical protein
MFGTGQGMLEKRLAAILPQSFTTNGGTDGTITVADASLFKVKQEVILKANTLSNLDTIEVKRVLSPTQLAVGPKSGNIDTRSDVSAYTVALNASIFANEQKRPSIPMEETVRAVYEEEPTVAQRSILVDKIGRKIDNVVDNNGVNRLAVDGQFHAEVDVQVDVDIEGVYDPVDNPDPDNIGLVGVTRTDNPDETNQVQRISVKQGTVDTDTHSMDVSLHDHDGNAYRALNPLPVTGSYEKFFTVLAASKWMELATYDEVIPSFSNGNNDLTLTYREDGALLGEAVITNYTSLITWSIRLKRYIDDDDGTVLQDDDGTELNLD